MLTAVVAGTADDTTDADDTADAAVDATVDTALPAVCATRTGAEGAP